MMYTKANYKWLLSELHEAVFALIQLHNTSKAQLEILKSRYLSHVLSNHVKRHAKEIGALSPLGFMRQTTSRYIMSNLQLSWLVGDLTFL